MMRRLGALALIAALAGTGCEAWGIDPNLERMIDQARVDAYEATALFPDGRGMRQPPPGTVPLERVLGPREYVDGMRLGQPVTSIPIPVTKETLARGRERFDIVCAACHGVLGTGDSKVAENMTLRKPRSLHDEEVRGYRPGQLYAIVTDGYGLMPALANQLSRDDRWAVVAYVRALQLSQHARLAELPADVRARAQEALR